MKNVKGLLVTVAVTVALAVAVTAGPTMSLDEKECKEKKEMSQKIMTLTDNITRSLCNDNNTDTCLERKQDCQKTLTPDGMPQTKDEELLKWLQVLQQVMPDVKRCASELGYSNVVTTTDFTAPSNMTELTKSCANLLDAVKELRVEREQRVPLANCTMRKQGMLESYSQCVNGLSNTTEGEANNADSDTTTTSPSGRSRNNGTDLSTSEDTRTSLGTTGNTRTTLGTTGNTQTNRGTTGYTQTPLGTTDYTQTNRGTTDYTQTNRGTTEYTQSPLDKPEYNRGRPNNSR